MQWQAASIDQENQHHLTAGSIRTDNPPKGDYNVPETGVTCWQALKLTHLPRFKYACSSGEMAGSTMSLVTVGKPAG